MTNETKIIITILSIAAIITIAIVIWSNSLLARAENNIENDYVNDMIGEYVDGKPRNNTIENYIENKYVNGLQNNNMY